MAKKVIILGYPSVAQYQDNVITNTIGNIVRKRRIKKISKRLNSKKEVSIFTRNTKPLSIEVAIYWIGVLIILGVISSNIILSGNGSSLLDLFKSL